MRRIQDMSVGGSIFYKNGDYSNTHTFRSLSLSFIKEVIDLIGRNNPANNL